MPTVDPIYNKSEIDAIRTALNNRSRDIDRGYATPQTIIRDNLFFTLAINTGLRPSDLVTLPADESFWAGDTALVKMQKTNKYTEVGIGKSLRKALNDYWAAHSEKPQYLFYSTRGLNRIDGSHVTVRWAWDFFKKWAERAGVAGKYGGTTGRRTCATHIYMSTGRIEDAQTILGHKNPGTTAVYIGVLRRQAIEAQSSLSL